MGNRIRVNAGAGYDVVIDGGLLAKAGELAAPVLKGSRTALFTDSTVAPLYADLLEEKLQQAGFQTCRFVYEAGERSKNMDTVVSFLDFMAASDLTRKDAVVVLGGGVAGDMGGFAASIYQRGISFIQIPTTILAAVDSSVGGKTGVDAKYGKNLTGTFWQPSLVLCDTDTLQSLSENEIMDGYAEVIKSAAIRDSELFRGLEEGRFRTSLPEVIAGCVRIKSDVVSEDERESGVRRILNFGHTMAHSIELKSEYRISHGRAVAIGMLMVTKASEEHGLTKKGTYNRLYALISGEGYQTETEIPLEELCEAARHDKKTDGDSIHIVYLDRIGQAKTHRVKLTELYDFYHV